MDLIETPDNPIPEGAVATAITTRDGVVLRVARWPALRDQPCKGTICLFQGRTEFIEKYFETVRDLRARGFAVATLDWRGQGLSARALGETRKGHVRRFSDYDRDLYAFMKQLVLPDCPPPYFALAHSMGGAILMRNAHDHAGRWFDRMVFSSPMIALSGRAAGRPARLLTRLMRCAGLGRVFIPGGGRTSTTSVPFRDNVLTSDPVRYDRMEAAVAAAPALRVAAPTVGWLDTAYTQMAAFAVPSYARGITQPLLIIAAGQDTVVSTRAIERFAIWLRAGSHVVVPGARHELLMEQDRYRDQFWAAFDAFIPGSPTLDVFRM